MPRHCCSILPKGDIISTCFVVRVSRLKRKDGEQRNSSMQGITKSSVDTKGTGLHMHVNHLLTNIRSGEC